LTTSRNARSSRRIKRCAVELDNPPGNIVSAFVREKVTDQLASTARDDLSPINCVLLKGCALTGINLIADETGYSHTE
jgi:hypothetical protein